MRVRSAVRDLQHERSGQVTDEVLGEYCDADSGLVQYQTNAIDNRDYVHGIGNSSRAPIER